MDLTSQEQLCRKDTLKQFETYLENTTTILNDFVDKLGWSLDETPVDVVINYLLSLNLDFFLVFKKIVFINILLL